MLKTASRWNVVNSGRDSGEANMATDREALERIIAGATVPLTLRFFQWDQPTVSYGYLLNEKDAVKWANGNISVKRPTGGGAVLHTPSDLSFSLLWSRSSKVFSDNPRACYAEIHEIVKQAIEKTISLELELKQASPTTITCAPEPNQFSVCFQEPVCNDVMLGETKVVGGALRVTKQAMLYQGTIQLSESVDVDALCRAIANAFNYGN